MKKFFCAVALCLSSATAAAQNNYTLPVPIPQQKDIYLDNGTGNFLSVYQSLNPATGHGGSSGQFWVSDYCAGGCTTVAQQTLAFQSALAAALAAAPSTIYVPASPGGGLNWSYDSTGTIAGYAGPLVINQKGVSVRCEQSTINVTGGSFLDWDLVNGSAGGDAGLEGCRIIETDNPTSGVLLALYKAQHMTIDNNRIEGGFVDIECASCYIVQITNLDSVGYNSNYASGTIGFWVHRRAPTDANASTIQLTNFNIMSSSRPGIGYDILLQEEDGFIATSGHAGFSYFCDLCVSPQWNGSSGGTGDQMDNIFFANVNFDNSVNTTLPTGATGANIDFFPLAGYTMKIVNVSISGGGLQNAAGDCIGIQDPAVDGIAFSALWVDTCGNAGIHFTSGTHVNFVGGGLLTTNKLNAGSSAVEFGGSGNPQHLTVVGTQVFTRNNTPPAYNVACTAGGGNWLQFGLVDFGIDQATPPNDTNGVCKNYNDAIPNGYFPQSGMSVATANGGAVDWPNIQLNPTVNGFDWLSAYGAPMFEVTSSVGANTTAYGIAVHNGGLSSSPGGVALGGRLGGYGGAPGSFGETQFQIGKTGYLTSFVSTWFSNTNVPSVACVGGSGTCTLDSQAANQSGIVTEGTTNTGFTLTLSNPLPSGYCHVQITAKNAAAVAVGTPTFACTSNGTSTIITVSHTAASGTGAIFSYAND